MHQAYAELSGGEEARPLRLRIGRQEVTFGSQRLVSRRAGPNVRRSFDAARATGTSGGWTLDLLLARPVEVDAQPLRDWGEDDEALGCVRGRAKPRRSGADSTSTTSATTGPTHASRLAPQTKHGTRWASVPSVSDPDSTSTPRPRARSGPSAVATCSPGRPRRTWATASHPPPGPRGSASAAASSAATPAPTTTAWAPSMRCTRGATTSANRPLSGRRTSSTFSRSSVQPRDGLAFEAGWSFFLAVQRRRRAVHAQRRAYPRRERDRRALHRQRGFPRDRVGGQRAPRMERLDRPVLRRRLPRRHRPGRRPGLRPGRAHAELLNAAPAAAFSPRRRSRVPAGPQARPIDAMTPNAAARTRHQPLLHRERGERRVSWLELFLDLYFVVAVAKLRTR